VKAKPTIIILKTPELKRRAVEVISALVIDGPLMEVVVREHKKDRSAAQHSLLWLWYTVIANEMGETKEDVHYFCKRRFLVPIFTRDDPDGYGAMVEAVRTVHRAGLKADSKKMADQIVKLTSTTDCTVAQFTEYLNDIEKHYITIGVSLPHPEDRWIEAMGK
jgi:hypothetical protein